MKHLFLIFLFLLTYTPGFCAETPWELIRNEDGIKIYNRPKQGSDYNEYRGVAVVNAPMEVVIAVLTDVAANAEWVENVQEARMVKQINNYTSISYIAIDSPWPVANRDLVIKGIGFFDRKTSTYNIYVESLKDPVVPLRKGYVRIVETTNQWTLKFSPNSKDKTMIDYSWWVEPGGRLPVWLVQLFSKKQPYLTLQALRKMVKKKKYIEKAETSGLKKYLEGTK